MELWTGALSWWKFHWPDVKSAGLFWRNLFLNSLKPQHSIPCWLSVQWEPSACRSFQCCQKKGSSKVCRWICSVWPSWVWESQHASTGNSVFWSLGHRSRSSFDHMAFFPSLKQNFIAYRSSKVSSRPDCIFEIQSGFNRVYSNCCCICSFEPEIIKIGQSSHKMYSHKLLNFQESTTILNACTKKSGNLLKAPRKLVHLHWFSSSWFFYHKRSAAILSGLPFLVLRNVGGESLSWEDISFLFYVISVASAFYTLVTSFLTSTCWTRWPFNRHGKFRHF